MKTSAVLAGLVALPVALGQNTSCDQWASFSNAQYILSNDLWGQDAGEGWGCITDDGLTATSATFHADWQWSGGQSSVKSFPSVQRVISTGRLVSSISSMPTNATWSYTGGDIRADVAYDVFSSHISDAATWDGDLELMIWLGKYGDVGPLGSSQGTVTVAGRSWELFFGYNGAMQVYSFVAPADINDFTGDVIDFFHFLSENKGYNAEEQYLLNEIESMMAGQHVTSLCGHDNCLNQEHAVVEPDKHYKKRMKCRERNVILRLTVSGEVLEGRPATCQCEGPKCIPQIKTFEVSEIVEQT